MLWAKIRVLVEVSLWLAGAFNLAGLFVGSRSPDGGWLFPVVHVFSTLLEALFCTGCVVLVYQLCLRWFGRERLEGLMTTAQVLRLRWRGAGRPDFAAAHVPRPDQVLGRQRKLVVDRLLPPAWFAGFDDALAGSAPPRSWLLAALAVIVTALVLWLAFGKLAGLRNAACKRSMKRLLARQRARSPPLA